jgi:hypothetical protein
MRDAPPLWVLVLLISALALWWSLTGVDGLRQTAADEALAGEPLEEALDAGRSPLWALLEPL